MSLTRRFAIGDGLAPRTAPDRALDDARSVAPHDDDPPLSAKPIAAALSTASPSLLGPSPRPDVVPSPSLPERPKSRSTQWHPAVPSTSAAVPTAARGGRAC